MSVIVYTEALKGKVKKASLEAVNYASYIAGKTGTTVCALLYGEDTAGELGKAGASKVLLLPKELEIADTQAMCKVITNVFSSENSSVLIFSHDLTAKAVAPRVAARLQASLLAGAVDYPEINGNVFTVKKNVFSGKAIATYELSSDKKVISLLPNTFQVQLNGSSVNPEPLSIDVSSVKGRIKVIETKKSEGELSLPEAELVVSAGRGMKGPEHWGIIEELAKELGAATACSRPVSDIGWRPHHEHVGQTGIAIRPNLYIAVGISGAIQHLAGVNGSKTIVVINKDAEAPFFKAADYGIVGDAFEVVPRLTEAVKKFKSNSHS